MKKAICTLIIFCNSLCLLHAQEQEAESAKGSHQLSLMIGHTHIAEGLNDKGNKAWLVAPSWGFDYNYWLAGHWAVGLQTDIILEEFKVEQPGEEGEELERTRPFAMVPAVSFKPQKHSVFIAGIGGEFAKEGNFALTRLAYEYAWELPNHWELSASLGWDLKWNAYNTWTIGLVVSKLLKKKRTE